MSTLYFEIIKDDSLKIFFDHDYYLVDKNCYDYIRYTKVNNKGEYNGYFRDVSKNGRLLGNGYYKDGSKEGFFELYYPTGKLNCSGNYKNNNPDGVWEFFYENGKPERTIIVNEEGTRLTNYFDKNGNNTVINGNGKFKGSVFMSSNSNNLIATGEVFQGKPQGKWMSTYLDNMVFCKEVFENGVFIKGTFPNSMDPDGKNYNDKSLLNNFFRGNYLNDFDKFYVRSCEDSNREEPEIYSFDFNKFRSDLSVKIQQVIEADIYSGKAEFYNNGDSYLIIKFKINSEGKAESFTQISAWGQQFFNIITNSIRTYTKFDPSIQELYFHMKLSFPGGNSYSSSIEFSKNRDFTF